MTNHKVGPHHNMWTRALAFLRTRIVARRCLLASAEGGYTLVALLALMTVLALFALAAAPSIRHQAQREREIEAIFRGEEVAEAIRQYYSYQQRKVGNGVAALPTSVEQLLEGVSIGSTKRVQ